MSSYKDNDGWLEWGLDAIMQKGAIASTATMPSIDEMLSICREIKERYERGKKEVEGVDVVLMKRATWELAKMQLGSHFSGAESLYQTQLYGLPVEVYDTESEILDRVLELTKNCRKVLYVTQ